MNPYEDIVQQLPSMRAALALESAVRLDFSTVTLEMLPVVILALMFEGAETENLIYEELYDRNFRYDTTVVRYILDRFQGLRPRTDLWLCDPDGHYLPLFADSLPD